MNEKIANLMTSLDVTRKGAERIAAIVQVGGEILLEEGFSLKRVNLIIRGK